MQQRPDEVPQNALAYHWGDDPTEGSTNVHVVQVMNDECRSWPQPAWTDITIETALDGAVGRWTSTGRR